MAECLFYTAISGFAKKNMWSSEIIGRLFLVTMIQLTIEYVQYGEIVV